MGIERERVWLRREDFDAPPPPFRLGRAGLVRIGPDGDFELEPRVRLSANCVHAMAGHGVIDALNALSPEGTLGTGTPVLFRPSQLEAARRVLYEADRKTYGDVYRFRVDAESRPEGREYWIEVDNREYQRSLVRLVDVFQRGIRRGEGVFVEC